MASPTYILDPDGEVIIVLHNANAPFASPVEYSIPGTFSHTIPVFHFGLESSAQAIRESECQPNQLGPTFWEWMETKKGKKGKKKKKMKKRMMKTTMEDREPESIPTNLDYLTLSNGESPVEASASEVPDPSIGAPAAEVPPSDDPPVDADDAATLVHIQVSAKHLMFTSPVFKKMLKGGWQESIVLLQKGSVEITADSWDTEAFLILLRAIHGQHSQLPTKLTLEMLAKVAVIADYYQCKDALYSMTDTWFRNLKEPVPTITSRGLILWLWVSWFFRLPSEFKKSTSIAISRSKSSIGTWGLPIPGNIIDSMNETRREATDQLLDLLHRTRGAFQAGTRGCGFECRSIMYGALTMQMQSSNLLSPKPVTPFLNMSYDDLAKKILAFRSPRWYSSSTFSSFSPDTPHSCPDASFASVFAALKPPLEGLDLEMFTSS